MNVVEKTPILKVSDLRVEFNLRSGRALVLDGINFSLNAGETLGIVGESGCGKSMTSLALMGLIPDQGRIIGGSILLCGEELVGANEARMRDVRGRDISMIFQEPMTSLNPVFSIGNQIAETIQVHEGASRSEARIRAIEMLRDVGISSPEKRFDEYPHQLSGGMRQRVMIAMALACKPKVLIADEPTTALDVTVQAQVFDLLAELQESTGTAIILITHDMGVIAQTADRTAVMYAGRMIETGSVEEVMEHPAHPYTQGLISCVPHLEKVPSKELGPLTEIPGVVPPLTELGNGCAFEPRCCQKFIYCANHQPKPYKLAGTQQASCWLLDQELCHGQR